MNDGIAIHKTTPAQSAPRRAGVDPQIEAIVAARHGDPFAFLGLHEESDGLVVRAMLPGAVTVEIIDAGTGAGAAAAKLCHSDGLFIAALGRRKRFAYRLRVNWGDAEQEFEDAYCFPPVLGD